MKEKTKEHFVYEGLGFPIDLVDIPVMRTRGEWTPNIDYNQLQKAVLFALAEKHFSLTGNELKFIRKYFRKTLEAFGQEFGVTHAAVIDWEREENKPVKMNPATEKCIRLFIVDSMQVGDHKFRENYHAVEIKKLAKHQKMPRRKSSPPLAVNAQKVLRAAV